MSSVSIALFLYLGNSLDLPAAVELVWLFERIKGPIEQISNLRNKYSDVYLAMARVQNYLNLPEFERTNLVETKPNTSEYAVEINDQSFSWGLKTIDIDEMFDKMYKQFKGLEDEEKTEEEKEKEAEKLKKQAEEKKKQSKLDTIVALKNINLKIKKGDLVFVIGKVGSGKSSLLSAIIGDLLPVTQQ